MSPNLTLRHALILLLPPLMWAANAVVGRMAVGQIPPVLLNLLRWVVVALLLLPLGWRVLRDRAALRQRAGHLALLGLLGMGAYNALQYLALHTSSPLNVTLIAASSPVWMLGAGALFYGVQPTRRQLLGAALSLLGVVWVIARGSWAVLMQVHFQQGDLLMLLAIITWALYSWMLAQPPESMRGAQRPPWNWAEFLLAQTLFGLLWCSAASVLEHQWAPQAWHWTPQLAAIVLFVGVAPGLIAYRAWGIGVAAVGPAIAAFFANLTPLFAALISAALLGEWPKTYHAIAFALIVAGIVVSSRKG